MRQKSNIQGFLGLAISAAAAAIVFSAIEARADATLTFQLNNASGYALTELHVSPSFADSWGHDVLEHKVLFDGEAAEVKIAGGESTCVYDLRFVAEDGSMLEDVGIDLCSQKSYTLDP